MGPFRIDPGLTFWTLVTFAGLFLVLARFAFKPLQRILKEREDKIRDMLATTERAGQEARDLLEQNRRQLAEARDETRHIINEGHRVVASMKQEGRDRAKEEAAQIVRQARDEIDRELQKGLDELKGTVASLSVRISRQILREQIDEERHTQLADEFVERLKKSHARRPS